MPAQVWLVADRSTCAWGSTGFGAPSAGPRATTLRWHDLCLSQSARLAAQAVAVGRHRCVVGSAPSASRPFSLVPCRRMQRRAGQDRRRHQRAARPDPGQVLRPPAQSPAISLPPVRKHQRRAGSAGSGVALQPLVDRLRALLLQRQVLHADETPSAATRSRRGENQTPLYLSLLWAYRSNDLEPSDSRGLAAHRRSLCPRLARPRTRRGRPAAAA
jgi:hypothetical protein